MAKGKKLHEVQDTYNEAFIGLCCICSKPCKGWYARYSSTGVCSKVCMQVQDAKPKYPGYESEDFIRRQAEKFGDEDYGTFEIDDGKDS